MRTEDSQAFPLKTADLEQSKPKPNLNVDLDELQKRIKGLEQKMQEDSPVKAPSKPMSGRAPLPRPMSAVTTQLASASVRDKALHF